jgi:hypothetical protein
VWHFGIILGQYMEPNIGNVTIKLHPSDLVMKLALNPCNLNNEFLTNRVHSISVKLVNKPNQQLLSGVAVKAQESHENIAENNYRIKTVVRLIVTSP